MKDLLQRSIERYVDLAKAAEAGEGFYTGQSLTPKRQEKVLGHAVWGISTAIRTAKAAGVKLDEEVLVDGITTQIQHTDKR